MSAHLHRLAEERSLAYHRVVARRLESDPALLQRARERLDGWIQEGGRSSRYSLEWRRLVDLPLPELQAILVDPGERASTLRQSTPFAGALSPRERWELWARVRERFERASSGEAAGSETAGPHR